MVELEFCKTYHYGMNRNRNKEDYSMSLGHNIQYLRKQRKMTQEELAENMSVSRQTICDGYP